MTIAYPLQDINSKAKGTPTYLKMGHPAIVLEFRGNMAILKDIRGKKFPANTEKLIWSEDQ